MEKAKQYNILHKKQTTTMRPGFTPLSFDVMDGGVTLPQPRMHTVCVDHEAPDGSRPPGSFCCCIPVGCLSHLELCQEPRPSCVAVVGRAGKLVRTSQIVQKRPATVDFVVEGNSTTTIMIRNDCIKIKTI